MAHKQTTYKRLPFERQSIITKLTLIFISFLLYFSLTKVLSGYLVLWIHIYLWDVGDLIYRMWVISSLSFEGETPACADTVASSNLIRGFPLLHHSLKTHQLFQPGRHAVSIFSESSKVRNHSFKGGYSAALLTQLACSFAARRSYWSPIAFILRTSEYFSRMAAILSPDSHTSNFSGRPRKIGTHSGVFHADEAMACFMLMQLPEYQNAEIIRTRDPEVYKKCDIVVDVGGVYDPSAFRFDHHQRDFKETLSSVQPDKPWTIKLSSAGLVFCHFGRRVIAQLLGLDLRNETNAKDVDLIYDKVYESFVMEMDAIDNGVQQSDKPLIYQINTGLSSRVKKLNPRWNEPIQTAEIQDRFMQAVQLTGSEFRDKVEFYHQSWLPARQIVEDALLKRFENDPSGQIVRLPVGGCPWQDHLLQLEQEQQLSAEQQIKFVLYQDDSQKWRVQAVPVAMGSFLSRSPLPEPWRGLTNETLSNISGIPGCVFAHHSGFIGGNATFEGALDMACKTLQLARTESVDASKIPVPVAAVQ